MHAFPVFHRPPGSAIGPIGCARPGPGICELRLGREVPNPQAQQTFERSKLDWSEPSKPRHAELLEWYRGLIKLRFEKRGQFGHAKARVKFDAAARWLRFEHAGVLALFNLAAVAQRVPMPAGPWELAQSSEMIAENLPEQMPAHATRIYRRRALDT